MNRTMRSWIAAGALTGFAASGNSQPMGRGAVGECSIQQDQAQGVYVAELWPGGVVPYTFNANVSEEHRQVVLAAMAELESVCGCDFVERTNQADYVRYQNGTGNNSYVGRKGGLQVVNIVNWTLATLIHETMHALGCWHEQQRADRDQYVEVRSENIQPGHEHNFDIKNDDGETVVGWYDFYSIMHYPRFAWSMNGLATISARPEYERYERYLSRSEVISAGDRWVLAEMYGGDKPPGAFTQVSPSDSAAVGAGWAPAFAWNPSELADSYRLRVADNPGFVSPVIDVVTSETSYSGGDLADGEVYYWTVDATNAHGVTRVWPLEIQVLFTGQPPESVVYVDATSAGGDGSSWQTAYRDLADALGAGATAGGAPLEIRIAQGRYTPDRGTGDRSATFDLRSGMTVRSGYGGLQNPADPDETGFVTILSGDLADDDGPGFENNGENSFHVLSTLWQYGSPVVLEGLIVEGGNAEAPLGSVANGSGGGLLAERSDVRLKGCTFRRGSASNSCGGVAMIDTSAEMSGCLFEGNRQEPKGPYGAGAALGTFNGMRVLAVTDTVFTGNESYQACGLIVQRAALRAERCEFSGNTADMWAAAMAVYNTTDVDVRSCLFLDNTALAVDPGGGEGGAIDFFDGVTARMSNSLFAGNVGVVDAGAIWTGLNTDLTVVNCTFTLNSAERGGGIFTSDGYGGHSTTNMVNCIVYGNEGGEVVDFDGAVTSVIYSDVKGGYAGFGNIDADPEFDGQFAPASGSPVNDAGLGGVLDAEITEDVYGAPRVSDDPDAPGGMVIDMGAVEFAVVCGPDLNGDGVLDLFDFLAFVNLFNGQDEGADCVDDGGFDLFDFLCFVNEFNKGC